jgi:hypothetical protein
MAMKMANGKTATTSKENMEVLGPHFDKVYNNHRPVDFTILDDIPQRSTLSDIDSPIIIIITEIFKYMLWVITDYWENLP